MTRVRIPADALPFGPVQGSIQRMQGVLSAELPEVVVHRLPGRDVTGEISPGAAGAQHVEDGGEDAAQWVRARSAALRQRGQVALDALPLCVTQVARIARTHATERRPLRHVVTLQVTLLGAFYGLLERRRSPLCLALCIATKFALDGCDHLEQPLNARQRGINVEERTALGEISRVLVVSLVIQSFASHV